VLLTSSNLKQAQILKTAKFMKKVIFTLIAFLLLASTTQAQEYVKTDSTRIYPPNFFAATRTILPQKQAKTKHPKVANGATEEASIVDLPWKTGGTGRIGFAVNNYGNWSAGALNTTNIDTNIDLFADYQKGNFTWLNNGEFDIGLVGSNAFIIDTSANTRFWRKSVDIFAITSALDYKFSNQLSLTLPLTFATQFVPTLQFQDSNPALTSNVSAWFPSDTNSIVSRFLSPAYFTLGTGIKWDPVAPDNRVIQFSAEILAQSKTTIIANENIARIYSLSPDASIVGDNTVGIYGNIIDNTNNKIQQIRPEIGAAANFVFTYNGIKNLSFNSRLGLFKNFVKNKFNGISDVRNTSLTVDVNWINKVNLDVPVTFWGKTLNLSTTFEHQLIKDADITVFTREGVLTKGIQSRFFFGLGLTYQFGYKK
jgi:hypothetical protein